MGQRQIADLSVFGRINEIHHQAKYQRLNANTLYVAAILFSRSTLHRETGLGTRGQLSLVQLLRDRLLRDQLSPDQLFTRSTRTESTLTESMITGSTVANSTARNQQSRKPTVTESTFTEINRTKSTTDMIACGMD